MDSLVLHLDRSSRPQPRAYLVHRRHDLSGTDYDRLGIIGIELATLVGRGGIAVRDSDAEGHRGTPGVVFSAGPRPYVETLDVRTDVADPATTAKTILTTSRLSDEVLGQMTTCRIDWLYGEPEE